MEIKTVVKGKKVTKYGNDSIKLTPNREVFTSLRNYLVGKELTQENISLHLKELGFKKPFQPNLCFNAKMVNDVPTQCCNIQWNGETKFSVILDENYIVKEIF